jgi:hypothetical protein
MRATRCNRVLDSIKQDDYRLDSKRMEYKDRRIESPVRSVGQSSDKLKERSFSMLLLRDHPLFTHREVRSWPPVWTWVGGSDNKRPKGEIGILKDVTPSNIEPANKCFLYIDHQGSSYVGCLLIDDTAFCREIVELLLANRNRTIAEIGGLDLSYTL